MLIDTHAHASLGTFKQRVPQTTNHLEKHQQQKWSINEIYENAHNII